MKLNLSPAAAALLRALLDRAGVSRDRIFLISFLSKDWHSLTFVGERHHVSLRIPGPDAGPVAARLVDGIEEAEFTLPGHLVGDIRLVAGPTAADDGSLSLDLEALTIAD